MMNQKLLLFVFFAVGILTMSCSSDDRIITTTPSITEIPDAIFEHILIDKGIDSDGTVNGQVLTSDVQNVTSLEIDGFYYAGGSLNEENYIHSLTGLEDFISLDSLTVIGTWATELPIQALAELKYLNCATNSLSELDLSGNPLLEYLIAPVASYDVPPVNTYGGTLDLSHNPNIRHIEAYNIQKINLKNGNNNPDMYIYVASISGSGGPDDSVCIAVDDVNAAQNGSFPYSEWERPFTFPIPINYVDDLEECP